MKSQLKITEKEKEKVYPYALNLVVHESDSLWQISNVFIVGNSLLSAFIANSLFSKNNSLGVLIISFIGLLITLVLLFSIERARKYHAFRIAQTKQREPKDWKLFNGDVEDFAKGNTIEIENKEYNVGFGKLSNILLVRIIVVIFIFFYLGIIVYKFPFDFKLKNFSNSPDAIKNSGSHKYVLIRIE